MQSVNFMRGYVAPAVVGKTFEDIVNQWRKDVAPNFVSLDASAAREPFPAEPNESVEANNSDEQNRRTSEG